MRRLEKKHPLAIRWFHWINFPILFVMIWSGLLIYLEQCCLSHRTGELHALHILLRPVLRSARCSLSFGRRHVAVFLLHVAFCRQRSALCPVHGGLRTVAVPGAES